LVVIAVDVSFSCARLTPVRGEFAIKPQTVSQTVLGNAPPGILIKRGGVCEGGVVFVDLCPADQVTTQFFPSRDPARSAALMQALDAVNRRYGRERPAPAALGWSDLSYCDGGYAEI
jgi:hypothetical protein